MSGVPSSAIVKSGMGSISRLGRAGWVAPIGLIIDGREAVLRWAPMYEHWFVTIPIGIPMHNPGDQFRVSMLERDHKYSIAFFIAEKKFQCKKKN